MKRISHKIKKKVPPALARSFSLHYTNTGRLCHLRSLLIILCLHHLPIFIARPGAHHVIHYSNNCVVPPSSFCPPPHKKHYTEKERNWRDILPFRSFELKNRLRAVQRIMRRDFIVVSATVSGAWFSNQNAARGYTWRTMMTMFPTRWGFVVISQCVCYSLFMAGAPTPRKLRYWSIIQFNVIRFDSISSDVRVCVCGDNAVGILSSY